MQAIQIRQAEQLSVIQYGLGPIGIKIMQSCLASENVLFFGAVDIDPQKVGRDAGELADSGHVGIKVVQNLNEVDTAAISGRKIALHATGSNLSQVWPQIRLLLDEGYSVVSTCEQLSFPWHRYPELAGEIDQYARARGQFVIGTGVNPGYIMDAMTLFATSITQSISKISVFRKVDVSKRRIPLQKKVGIGMTPEEFIELAQNDRIGHVGLEESLRLIAYGLNLSLETVNNKIEPLISQEDKVLAIGPLKKNEVTGLHQNASGMTEEGVPIELDLIMSVDINQEDRIVLDTKDLGVVEFVVPQGIFGDTATVNVVVNTAKTLLSTDQAGLLTMADIPLTRNKK
jgi:2,4-diaminopentanoate dehydrogenase